MAPGIPIELLRRALDFYEGTDGQYYEDVVVPLIKAEIKRRTTVDDLQETAQRFSGAMKRLAKR
jgi:hypothetical protein